MVSFHKKFQPVSVDGNQSNSGGKYLFTTEGLPSDLSLGTSRTGCLRKKDRTGWCPQGGISGGFPGAAIIGPRCIVLINPWSKITLCEQGLLLGKS